jgi:hypothetical protein
MRRFATGQATIISALDGYCRQPYTSTWTGSAWGNPVASGAASCSATFPSGANEWVAETSTPFTQEWDMATYFPFGPPVPVPGFYPYTLIVGPFAVPVMLYSGSITGGDGCTADDLVYVNGANVSPGNTVTVPPGTVLADIPVGQTAYVQVYNATGSSSSGGGGKIHVRNVVTASATFTNAAGTGDFDCVVGGEACASVPSTPCLLPSPIDCSDCSQCATCGDLPASVTAACTTLSITSSCAGVTYAPGSVSLAAASGHVSLPCRYSVYPTRAAQEAASPLLEAQVYWTGSQWALSVSVGTNYAWNVAWVRYYGPANPCDPRGVFTLDTNSVFCIGALTTPTTIVVS